MTRFELQGPVEAQSDCEECGGVFRIRDGICGCGWSEMITARRGSAEYHRQLKAGRREYRDGLPSCSTCSSSGWKDVPHPDDRLREDGYMAAAACDCLTGQYLAKLRRFGG